MENDNRPADPEMESSSSSLSFILAEEIDSIQPDIHDDNSNSETDIQADEVGIDSLAVMTKSQYAQVSSNAILHLDRILPGRCHERKSIGLTFACFAR